MLCERRFCERWRFCEEEGFVKDGSNDARLTKAMPISAADNCPYISLHPDHELALTWNSVVAGYWCLITRHNGHHQLPQTAPGDANGSVNDAIWLKLQRHNGQPMADFAPHLTNVNSPAEGEAKKCVSAYYICVVMHGVCKFTSLPNLDLRVTTSRQSSKVSVHQLLENVAMLFHPTHICRTSLQHIL